MSLRPLLPFAAVALILAGGSQAEAHTLNALMRSMGLGWSNGYHAQEGCPTEKIGRRNYPGYPAGGGYGVYASPAPYGTPMPERPDLERPAAQHPTPAWRNPYEPQLPSARFDPLPVR